MWKVIWFWFVNRYHIRNWRMNGNWATRTCVKCKGAKLLWEMEMRVRTNERKKSKARTELNGRTVEKWIGELMEIIKEPSHWIFAIVIPRYSPKVQFSRFHFFRLFYFSLFISSSQPEEQHSTAVSVCMKNEPLTCTQNVINVYGYCMQSLPSFQFNAIMYVTVFIYFQAIHTVFFVLNTQAPSLIAQ